MPQLTPEQQAKVDAFAAALADADAGRRPEPDEAAAFDPFAFTEGDDEDDPFSLIETINEVVASNMRNLRLDAGLGQRELAEAMSALGFTWHRQTVAEIERVARRVALEEMFGLAALFGVPVVALLHTPHGVAIDLQVPGLVVLPADHAQELIHGRGAKPGKGGPQWAAAARAVTRGIEVERPARALWKKRRAEGKS